MSQRISVDLDHDGIRELLKSDEVKSACKEYGDKAMNRLGDGYELSAYSGQKRVNVFIRAETQKARRENLKQNTILKAVCGK